MIDNEERMEAGYLQMKYERITIDEVLDFHNRLLSVVGADAFIRQGAYTPRVAAPEDKGKIVKWKTTTDLKYRFHCNFCGCHFEILGKLSNGTPCCPGCGSAQFYEENK